jgi:hypothetical protein
MVFRGILEKVRIFHQVWFASLHCVHHWSMASRKIEATFILFHRNFCRFALLLEKLYVVRSGELQ